MRIWVDADACPKIIKEILFRVADRTQTLIILVSNQHLKIPPSPFITKMQVAAGFDAADQKIIESVQSGDIVITADIPLADAVITKKCTAINPRGELYSSNNIKERLALRNLNDTLRGGGMITGGPAQLGKKEVQAFANQLDRIFGKTSDK